MAQNETIHKRNPNVWFVAQGSTYNSNEGMKYLWAPQKNKKDGPVFYWENVKKVRKGDLIFHYSKGIRGVSIARSDWYHSENKRKDDQWDKEGYRVDVEFTKFNPIIPLEKIKENKFEFDQLLKKVRNKPFDINGNVNQGYLYEFTSDAGLFIRELYGKRFDNDEIDAFFDKLDYPDDFKKRSKENTGEFTLDKNDSGNNQIFNLNLFFDSIKESRLFYSEMLLKRFISSLLTKPFVILTGLSGSGKTKLAQAFVQWICQDESQYKIVPVGADWTNREPLLGYPNALKPEEYLKPDSGVLELIIEAGKEDNSEKPYFLILDEMNLSQVERYFADFLSVMESKEEIPLFAEGTVENGVPAKLVLPSNLFIIGTVNIDDTTNMFSPKVLDRANTIEFRVTKKEIKGFLDNVQDIDMNSLVAKGAGMAKDFLSLASNKTFEKNDIETINGKLLEFFIELKKTGAEFGYRSASEILRLINQLTVLDENLTTNEKLDIAIMQKLLPKLHGSRRKLTPILKTLGSFCLEGEINIEKDVFGNEEFDFNASNVLFPLSLEKISRMHKGAVDNGYTSFAEA